MCVHEISLNISQREGKLDTLYERGKESQTNCNFEEILYLYSKFREHTCVFISNNATNS